MSVTVLSSKQISAEFELQHFYGAGQRGLRHIALLRRAREVQLLGNREEIADLVHLHGSTPSIPRSQSSDGHSACSNHAAIVAPPSRISSKGFSQPNRAQL